VVDEILKLMEYQFKIKTFNVLTDLNPSDLFISADRDAIIEAIINIISNSIKFSVDKKSLIISTYKEKNFIVIKIADKGVGIPKGEIEKIFEPFIKSEKISFELNSGAGLGLSIVKHIMDAHKGKIKIKSKVNEGTVVFLEFPVGDIND
jgi:two-component system phosphate regulon sensor histidine kinase PhoR